jgi:hypothetical protein
MEQDNNTVLDTLNGDDSVVPSLALSTLYTQNVMRPVITNNAVVISATTPET